MPPPALRGSADPLGAKDQAQLAAIVVKLCEDIGGLVVVVDHSRKNRPEGQPLSSADIFGPPQKWAAAEHIVMLDVVDAGRRLEVFIEGKDLETRRFFLTVTPRGAAARRSSPTPARRRSSPTPSARWAPRTARPSSGHAPGEPGRPEHRGDRPGPQGRRHHPEPGHGHPALQGAGQGQAGPSDRHEQGDPVHRHHHRTAARTVCGVRRRRRESPRLARRSTDAPTFCGGPLIAQRDGGAPPTWCPCRRVTYAPPQTYIYASVGGAAVERGSPRGLRAACCPSGSTRPDSRLVTAP